MYAFKMVPQPCFPHVSHVCQFPKVLMACILLLALNPGVTVHISLNISSKVKNPKKCSVENVFHWYHDYGEYTTLNTHVMQPINSS